VDPARRVGPAEVAIGSFADMGVDAPGRSRGVARSSGRPAI
jgi:hypothetical protein